MPDVLQFDVDDVRVGSELRSIIERNDLILFVGAGLSAQAATDDGQHPPLWQELMKKMIEWCEGERIIDAGYAQQIRELVDADLLLDAGQELEDAIKPSSPSALQRCLNEVLLCNRAETSMAHRLVTRIPFRGFLTTNYDDFIESAYVRTQRRTLPKFYEDTYEGVLEAWRSRQPFILKIHGDVTHPSSIVLGRRSYERMLYENEQYSRCLEQLIGGSSILFVGFGGSDPNLEHILSRASIFDGRSKRHWMVAPSRNMPALKAKRLWSDKGINVIVYHGSHSNLNRFLRNLAKADAAKPGIGRASRIPPAAVRRR
jgi:hypothetical protein